MPVMSSLFQSSRLVDPSILDTAHIRALPLALDQIFTRWLLFKYSRVHAISSPSTLFYPPTIPLQQYLLKATINRGHGTRFVCVCVYCH
jgi:hypothetical protein